MREPNMDDANLALRLYDLRRESEMRKGRSAIGNLVAESGWEEIAKVLEYEHPENAHWRQVTSFWELAASFVNRGIFHPDVYMDSCGEGLFTFGCLKPFLAQVREKTGPRFMSQTERVVNAHPACRERVEGVEKMAIQWRADAAKEAGTKGKKKSEKTNSEKGRKKGIKRGK